MVPNGDEHSYRRLPRISELRIVVRDQIRPAAHEKKLSDAQEDEILRRSEAGMSRSQLATEFKVSRRPIKNAIESAKARRGSTLAVVTTTWPRASQGIAPKPARKPRRS
jgi:DNA-binding CsgD family transcriptional regulator